MNKPEAASSLLDKAAKIVEKARPEDAIGNIYYFVCILIHNFDKPVINLYKKASSWHRDILQGKFSCVYLSLFIITQLFLKTESLLLFKLIPAIYLLEVR